MVLFLFFCFILKLSEKVLDINDLSGTVSPLERDDKEETKEEEENEGGAKTQKAKAAKRYVFLFDIVPGKQLLCLN